MAKSYAHMYGEIIGDFFEESLILYLRPTVEKLGYYLDYRHEREARNGQKEVRWADSGGNNHKLDIVVEENGSEKVLGTPRAFIEMAWRRYSKHSKNKVQEISGAILPLIEKFKKSAPFYSAVLSGEFTNNALEQLRSQGFTVCYIDLDKMEEVFSAFGFNVIWSENTPESFFKDMVVKYQKLSKEKRYKLYEKFVSVNKVELEQFKNALVWSLSRKLERVIIIPTHGLAFPFTTVEDACSFIKGYDENNTTVPVLYYEVKVVFNTQEEYSCKCKEKAKAIEFLNNYI